VFHIRGIFDAEKALKLCERGGRSVIGGGDGVVRLREHVLWWMMMTSVHEAFCSAQIPPGECLAAPEALVPRPLGCALGTLVRSASEENYTTVEA